MNRFVLSAVGLLGVVLSVNAGLDDGLISHYTFDDHAQDVSGHGHHASLIDGSYGTDAEGAPSSSLELDGINDHAIVPDSTELRLNNTDFTLSAWVYLDNYSTDNASAILAKRYSTSHSGWIWAIIGESSATTLGTVSLHVSGGTEPRLNSTTVVSLHQWTLVTTTFDKESNTTFMFVNGEPCGSTTSVPQPNGSTDSNMYIGMDSVVANPKYWTNGKLDDIRIYNRTLSQAEITELYTQGVPSINQGLVAHWPLDGNAEDISGNEHDGILYGDITETTDRYDNLDSAYDFDEEDDCISIWDAAGLNNNINTTQGSLSVWVNPRENRTRASFVCNYNSHNDDRLYLQYGDPNFRFAVGGSWITSNTEYPYNSWYHIVAIWAGNTLKLYIDGMLDGEGELANPGFVFQGENLFYIGRGQDASGDAGYYHGKIDDVRIYNRALSASEVVQLYTQEKHLKNITISGPTSVPEGSLTEYTCTAHFTDGSSVDVSEDAAWSDNSEIAEMLGSKLQAGKVDEDYPLQIKAIYKCGNESRTEYKDVLVQPSLDVSIWATATYKSEQNQYEVLLTPFVSHPDGEVSYLWDIDGDGVKDDSVEYSPSFYLVPGATRLVGVEVVDSADNHATAWLYVTKDKPPVTGETRLDESHYISTSDIAFKDKQGNAFSFDVGKIDNGLIIIAHGLRDAATNEWVQDMAESIENRLNNDSIPLPNIALYDWSSMSNPDKYRGLSADFNGPDDWKLIRNYGVAQGDVVADWIRRNIDLGNINQAKDIHFIGHSAGGFVAGRCASLLGDTITQITMLDTPAPYDGIYKSYLPADGLVEAYLTSWGTASRLWEKDYPDQSFVWQVYYTPWETDSPPSGVDGHSWGHDWYTERTVEDEERQIGFYYSPFMGNGFHGYTPAEASAMAMMAMAAAEATTSTMLITNFSSFGDVVMNDPQYTITEAANAGIYKELVLPIGAQSIGFQYQFTSAGDGDFLSVHWGTNETSFIGLDLGISRSNFVDGIVSLTEHAGTTNTLTFKLVSRNATNAVLSISNIVMEVSSDPDDDGLDTDTETSLGTDPLDSDSDGDGIGDGDEVNTYGSDPNLPDSDHDGMTDGQEVQCGTSPTNAMDKLEIVGFSASTNQEYTLKWSSVGGKQYDIRRSTSLPMDSYTTVGNGIYATAPTNTFTDSDATNSVHFYRVLLKE